ncbi:MAG TPA: hypothetical protein VLE53_18745 [Gemmatimonadaceae bacterium]|nr:hypothetical protein [Gemmatimonadaceae bacterium]
MFNRLVFSARATPQEGDRAPFTRLSQSSLPSAAFPWISRDRDQLSLGVTDELDIGSRAAMAVRIRDDIRVALPAGAGPHASLFHAPAAPGACRGADDH